MRSQNKILKSFQAFIASSAEIFTALVDGKNPAPTPMNTEKRTAAPISHSGIIERAVSEDPVSIIAIMASPVSDAPI